MSLDDCTHTVTPGACLLPADINEKLRSVMPKTTTTKPPARLVRRELARLCGIAPEEIDQSDSDGDGTMVWTYLAVRQPKVWRPIPASTVRKAEAAARKLHGAGGKARISGSTPPKGVAGVGRRRIKEPDPTTPSGQFALYLAHLCKDYDPAEVAERAGISRATLFNYFNAATSPDLDVLDRLAKALGMNDYRAMMPSDRFLATLPKRPKRK